MENTLENKAKFFAQYWGQKIVRMLRSDGLTIVNGRNLDRNISVSCLELKPLSQISDEDAITLKLFINKKKLDWNDELTQIEADYLRSKGYALPYNGISVETLIEWEWLTLKQ